MSDFRWLRYGFAHEQTPRSAVHYVRERFKRRQRPLRVVVPAAGAEPTDGSPGLFEQSAAEAAAKPAPRAPKAAPVEVQKASQIEPAAPPAQR